MSEKVGFIGLGIMGQGMAKNLMEAGFDVNVWNRTPARMDPFCEAGARCCSSPADVAAHSDIIITCVSNTADVEEVILRENGVIYGAKEGSLVIDMSTISPETSRYIAGALKQKGVAMLDAPVSGGSEGAAKGTLSIMVGGDEQYFQRALPVLEAMGKTITHVGDTGAGQTVKLVNQILVVVTMLGVSEALLFAQAGGLDLQKTLDAVSQGAAGKLGAQQPRATDDSARLASRFYNRSTAKRRAPGSGSGRRDGRASARNRASFSNSTAHCRTRA